MSPDVRMAERSKAPDSRFITFPAHNGSGRSGLRMEAWVRIPLLTMLHPFFFFLIIQPNMDKIRELVSS